MENKRMGENSRAPEGRGIKMKRKPMFDESGTTLLNGIKINFEKGFGFNQNVDLKNSAHCIDDNRILYVLASQIVLYDMLSESQRVIDTFDFQEEIGSLIFFKNIMLEDNIIYALHNSNKSFPSLVLHNFSKNFTQKIMLANLEKEEKVVEIALLNDFRNVALISTIDKIIRLTVVEVVTKEIKMSEYLSFLPLGIHAPSQFPTKLILQDSMQIYVTDVEQELKFTSLLAKKMLEAQSEKIVQIAASLHMDFSLYAITNKGNLYFFNIDMKQLKITKVSKQFLGTYKTLDEAGQQIICNKKPSSICANEYNILIGYEHIEEFTLLKICAVSTQPPQIQIIKFSCPYLHKIVRMNFAVETMAVCVIVQVKQNDKYDFSIPIESQFLKEKGEQKIIKQNSAYHALPAGKIFPIIFNLLLYDTLVETLRSPVQTVLNPMLLTKKILDVSVLPTKKLILVLSADKKIKAIKYEHVSSISFERMLAWQMIFNVNDQPNSLDVHPLTFNAAVGFKEGVKIFNIFSDGMKTTNIHFPLKNCESVRYSRFGHLLIAGSSNQIILINPYENKIKNTIQLNHGFITKEINFIDRDMYLFGSFTNGTSQIMTLEGVKLFQVSNKSSKCIHSCYDPVFDIMIMSFDDNEVKFYRERGEMEFAIMWTYPFIVTKILIVNELGTAFMGTSTGKIRAYQWPFTDMIKFNKSYTQIQLHRTSVTQIRVAHDYSYLITGSEDGSIFLSKICPYSDGMIVSDSSILHTFKANNKSYASLYYLQNFMCTNNSIESQKEEEIVQYQSDKADFDAQYTYILQNLQTDIEGKLKNEEQFYKNALKNEIEPYENQIEEINRKKLDLRDETNKFNSEWTKQIDSMEEAKLNKMREFYRKSDHLKVELEFYTNQFRDEIEEFKEKYETELKNFRINMENQEIVLLNDCNEIEKEFKESIIHYGELMKEEEQQGFIYKRKMMEQLQAELLDARHIGEDFRKIYNKNRHDIHTEQDKLKYFQQLISEMRLDIENAQIKRKGLLDQITYLSNLLKQKDQQIFDEEKAVKELLKKSINNYSHEEYLKHKQDELIEKAKYLENQINDLDDKYQVFQQNFIEASKETNEYILKTEEAYRTIQELKEKNKNSKQKKFMKKYKIQEVYIKIMECFHQCHSKPVFAQKVKRIFNVSKSEGSARTQEKLQVNVDKRDHLIEQVVNTNKLRKIDDTIRKTIMIKLSRQTVNLTSEVNELRKQKKLLVTKIKDLQSQIKEVASHFPDKENQQEESLTDIVPVNISVIRSQNSKHIKPLPFQVYQQNKLSQRSSNHSKINAKSITEENSTQLPSIIKNSQSYSGSVIEQSSLFGVEQNEDEIVY